MFWGKCLQSTLINLATKKFWGACENDFQAITLYSYSFPKGQVRKPVFFVLCIVLCEERDCEIKQSCQRTQHNNPNQLDLEFNAAVYHRWITTVAVMSGKIPDLPRCQDPCLKIQK